MSTINQLSPITSALLGSGDQFVVYSGANGDARKLSATELLSYLNTNFASPTFVTTVTTPGDGFVVTMAADGTNQWALLQPTGALASGTVNLPAVATAVDGQECIITSTLQIVALTIGANGATNVYGAPAVFAAEDSVKFRFNKTQLSWYKVA